MGAFDFGGDYRKGQSGLLDPRLASAIRAFKRELIYNGSRRKLRPWLPVYGDAMTQAVMDLQRARELPVTGRIDPGTAKELFRKRVETVELGARFPHGTLGKKLWHESRFDPVAVGGEDDGDRGISQISLKRFGGYHDVTLREAYNPAFAIRWAAGYVTGKKTDIERRLGPGSAAKYDTLRAARASYNVGAHYAAEWAKAGFPQGDASAPKGSPAWWFARATAYLSYIDHANF